MSQSCIVAPTPWSLHHSSPLRSVPPHQFLHIHNDSDGDDCCHVNERKLRSEYILPDDKCANDRIHSLNTTLYRNHPRRPDPSFLTATIVVADQQSHSKRLSYLHNILVVEPAQPSHRSLTCPATFVQNYDDMTTTFTAPNSPPDLSGSKSSKSSSDQSSSQHDGADGILTDISNFEDIGLDDDSQLPYTDPYAFDRQTIAKRPVARIVSVGSMRHNTSQMTSTRELTTAKRPGFPSLRGQVKSAIGHRSSGSLSLPKSAPPVRRGFTSPSTPSLPLPSSARPRSRSPSPSYKRSVVVPLSTIPLSNSPLRSPGFAPHGPSRRGSWQPSRKSVKELEEECHDSDDDLPDETSLWNVPLSPRLPQHRSASTSPERGFFANGPGPIPLSHTVSAPANVPTLEPVSRPLPKHRLPPRKTSLPVHGNLRDARAKSWTSAMSSLSEEAKHLTEALEFHAETSERKHEENVQNGVHSSRPSLETTRSTSRTLIELPPLNKGNVMIDPLPISKEKEKVLTRTRPSWLPPKDPKEEKKHIKEYQRMMAASVEAEKRKEARVVTVQCEKDDTRATLNRIWEEYVYPDWQRVVSEHRTRELWWRGVAPRCRGMVWKRAVGNDLALVEETYHKALKRAKDLQVQTNPEKSPTNSKMLHWFAEIKGDTEFAYPELHMFQKGAPLHTPLVDVLSAYSMYRSDVGYLYGVHLIAALLLLQLDTPAQAFIVLANALNKPLLLAFLTGEPSAMQRAYTLATSTLEYKFPRVHKQLFDQDRLNFSPDQVFEPMFRTLFANGLDLERLARVWDCWVFEGDRIVIRTAVAILGCLGGRICTLDSKEQTLELLGWGPRGKDGQSEYWDLRAAGDEDAFMHEVREAGKVDPKPASSAENA